MRGLSLGLMLAVAGPAAAQPTRAEWIVHGGPVLTLEAERPVVEAAAFANGAVLALGRLDEVRALHGPAPRELDLRGHSLVPSFKDHHVHLLNLGLALLNHERQGALQAELAGMDLASIAAGLAARCQGAPAGAWVTGAGWSQGVWGASALPRSRAADGGWQPENRLGRLEALLPFTARQAAGGVPLRPALSVGGPADWIVDDANPLGCAEAALPRLRTLPRPTSTRCRATPSVSGSPEPPEGRTGGRRPVCRRPSSEHVDPGLSQG